ncbi:MAG: RadC family protein, partial [Lysobacteraceae bacterium]
MGIRDWPVEERPRERLLALGEAAVADAELLAVLLGTGPKGMDAVSHARRLLAQTGGLRALLDLDAAALCALPGMGPARASLLRAALAVGHRHLRAELVRGATLDGPQRAGEYFSRWLRHAPNERFAALFLDNRHRLLAERVLFEGSIDSAAVHPRVVVQEALRCNAAAVVVAHNHPSGVAEPSAADRQLTVQLKQALALVDVRLLDHFVV